MLLMIFSKLWGLGCWVIDDRDRKKSEGEKDKRKPEKKAETSQNAAAPIDFWEFGVKKLMIVR